MKILQSTDNLQQIILNLAFREPPFSLEEIIQSFVRAEFKDNVYIKMIFEVSPESDNVAMMQTLVNPDFAS